MRGIKTQGSRSSHKGTASSERDENTYPVNLDKGQESGAGVPDTEQNKTNKQKQKKRKSKTSQKITVKNLDITRQRIES